MAITDILNRQFVIGSNNYLFNADIRIKINQFYEYDKQLRQRITDIVNIINDDFISKNGLSNYVFVNGFNTHRRLIQMNMETGVTYVSKEISFYNDNNTGLDMRIGKDDKTNTFRVRQQGIWSDLITGKNIDDKSYLGSFSGKDAFFNGNSKMIRLGIGNSNEAVCWVGDYLQFHKSNGTFLGSVTIDNNTKKLKFQSTATNNEYKNVILENDFLDNKNEHGFSKLPNGLIIQWGRVDLSTMNSANNQATGILTTFPTAFLSKCLSITANDRGSATLNIGIKEGDKNEQNKNTHFRVWAKKNDNTWATSGVVSYIAIGF